MFAAPRSVVRSAAYCLLLAGWLGVPGTRVVGESPQQDSRTVQRAYADGVDEIRDGRWAAAERSMRTAIEKGPPASPANRNMRVRLYGAIPEPFFPEYFLAVALMNQPGKEAEALKLFKTVSQNNLLPADAPDYASLATNITRLETQLAPPADPDPPPAGRTAPPPPDLLGRGAGGGVPTRGGAALADPPVRNEEEPEPPPKPPDRSAEIAELVNEARQEIQQGRFTSARSVLQSLRQIDARNAQLGALTRQVTNGLDALATQERAAIRLFFEGQYEDASENLGRLLAQPDGKTPRAYFYTACSQAALGLLEGADGRDRIDAARQALSSIPDSSAIEQDRKFISPAILGVLFGAG